MSPMGQAINAAATALETVWGEPADVRAHQARVAIVAAYPHLLQALARETRELRAEVGRLTELLSPTS